MIILIANNTEKKEVCVFDWDQSQKFIGTFEKLVTVLNNSLSAQVVPTSWEQAQKTQDREDAKEDLALWRDSVLKLLGNSSAQSIVKGASSIQDLADFFVSEHSERRAARRKALDEE